MVKMGPPDSVFDGLNLSRSKDRVTALTRLCGALENGEKMLVQSSNDAGKVVPSPKQLKCLWMSVATISAGVQAVAKAMIAKEKEQWPDS